MKRIIFIAALLIAAAMGARAQEKDNLKIIDFDYERHISGYDAYHWKFDGSSELEMLRELIEQTANYLKWK